MNRFSSLREFCETPAQHRYLDALDKTNGNVVEATKLLGMNRRNLYDGLKRLQKKQAAAGKGDHFIAMNNLTNTGLAVKGTSTMYKDGEPVIQWVKTNKAVEEQYEAFVDLLSDETVHLHKYYKTVQAPKNTVSSLVTNYITTDLHFGALMWHEEVGHDYDLDIARETLLASAKHLVDTASPTDKCIISDIGDLVEADDFTNMTKRSGNILDVDGRYPKVLRVVRDTFIELIYLALEKHKHVDVILVKGNHDDMTSFFIQEYLSGYFRNEPRVNVDTSLKQRKYYIHGSTLIGYTHGHEMKPIKCGEVMAHECREVFHKTLHRYFHFGHFHKDASGENVICKWEIHKNLPPSNAWATGLGYVGMLGTMRAITYDKDHGEVDRVTFSVSRVRGTESADYESRIL